MRTINGKHRKRRRMAAKALRCPPYTTRRLTTPWSRFSAMTARRVTPAFARFADAAGKAAHTIGLFASKMPSGEVFPHSPDGTAVIGRAFKSAKAGEYIDVAIGEVVRDDS